MQIGHCSHSSPETYVLIQLIQTPDFFDHQNCTHGANHSTACEISLNWGEGSYSNTNCVYYVMHKFEFEGIASAFNTTWGPFRAPSPSKYN